MSTTALQKQSGTGVAAANDQATAAALEQVIMGGDLKAMPPAQRLAYYDAVCKSVGLNPITQPFQYVTLQGGKMSLYATRNCTDQLRAAREINLAIVSRETLGDTGVYVVTARAQMPNGRSDESTGAVNIAGLKGEMLANALMKAETKAKRRVTLSICGLSFADDSEVDSIPGARRATFDTETGEIHEDAALPAPSTPQAPAAVSERTMKRLHARGRECGFTPDEIHVLAEWEFGVQGKNDLTEEQAAFLADNIHQRGGLVAAVIDAANGAKLTREQTWVAAKAEMLAYCSNERLASLRGYLEGLAPKTDANPTAAALGKLFFAAEKRGLTPSDLLNIAGERYGVESLEELERASIADLESHIRSHYEEAK